MITETSTENGQLLPLSCHRTKYIMPLIFTRIPFLSYTSTIMLEELIQHAALRYGWK